MLPLLVFFQIIAIYLSVQNAQRDNHISAKQSFQIYSILAALSAWACISVYLGINGYYQTEAFLSSLPGFWITQMPVLIIMIPLMISKPVRDAINSIIDNTPLYKIMVFEAVRILAIGTIIKAYRGEFSTFFAYSIGVLDLVFGALALIAAILIYQGKWKQRAAIYINLYGFLLIVPLGMTFINMGLPGIFHIVEEKVGLESIFHFPMLLAPTSVVPTFVIVNLLVAVRLVQRGYLKD